MKNYFKKVIAFFKNLKKNKTISNLVKVVKSAAPVIKDAMADGSISPREQKEIIMTVVEAIIVSFYGKDRTAAGDIAHAVEDIRSAINKLK